MGRQSRQKRDRRDQRDTPPWTTFTQADSVRSQIRSPAEIAEYLEAHMVFVNSRYHVHVSKEASLLTPAGYVVVLSIRNNDRSVRRDWRDFQRIKNELLGPDWEAVELYPAEERLVDTANQFYLFCVPPPYRFPFGFRDRLVAEGGGGGAVQRDWGDARPPDCLTPEDIQRLVQEKKDDQL